MKFNLFDYLTKSTIIVGLFILPNIVTAKNNFNDAEMASQYRLTSAQTTIDNCKYELLEGIIPKVQKASLLNGKSLDQTFCLEGIAVGYSYDLKGAFWSAHRLTKERVKSAQQLPREDSFHEETAIPSQYRAVLDDYRGQQTYDRGHLTPNGDFPTMAQQYHGFSLANVVPQIKSHNQGAWRALEEATRILARKEDTIYVITGAIYPHTPKKMRAISVPSHIYKILYFPKRKLASVYYSPNDDRQKILVISLNQLETMTGFNYFPTTSFDKKLYLSLPFDKKQAWNWQLRQLSEADISNEYKIATNDNTASQPAPSTEPQKTALRSAMDSLNKLLKERN